MNSSERALLRRMASEKGCKLSYVPKDKRPSADDLENFNAIVSAQISANEAMRERSVREDKRNSSI